MSDMRLKGAMLTHRAILTATHLHRDVLRTEALRHSALDIVVHLQRSAASAMGAARIPAAERQLDKAVYGG